MKISNRNGGRRLRCGLPTISLAIALLLAGCHRQGIYHQPGGPETRAGIGHQYALALMPYQGEIRIAPASSTDIFVLRRFNNAYVMARLGDTLNRIWTRTFKANPRKDLRAEGLVSDGRFVTALLARIAEDKDSLEYYTMTYDAVTGEPRGGRVLARYEQNGTADYATVAAAPDSSSFLLYHTDLHRFKHFGSLVFDAWKFPAACDTVAELHMPMTVAEEEKDNESPIIAAAALDYQGRLVRLDLRNDSTFVVYRIDMKSGHTDSLARQVGGFDFKDSDGEFGNPILLVDRANRVHVLGVRHEGRESFSNPNSVGEITMFLGLRCDFDANLERVVQCEVTPAIAQGMAKSGTLNSYRLFSALPDFNGGYILVVEWQFKQKAGIAYSRTYTSMTGQQYYTTYEAPAWEWNGDFGTVAIDSIGHARWEATTEKRGTGIVGMRAPTEHDGARDTAARLLLVALQDLDWLLYQTMYVGNGHTDTIDSLVAVNTGDQGSLVSMSWLPNNMLALVTSRDRSYTREERLKLDSLDQIEPGTIGYTIQSITKIQLPKP